MEVRGVVIRKIILSLFFSILSFSAYADGEDDNCFNLKKQIRFHVVIESELIRNKSRLETFLKINPGFSKITNNFAIRTAKVILVIFENKDTWSVSIPLLSNQSDEFSKIENISSNRNDSVSDNLAATLIESIDTVLRDADLIRNELIDNQKKYCTSYN